MLLDFLETNNFKYVFGNPGTYEQGFMEALSRRPGLVYILGLHESVAVAMADGYARARGRPGFVNLHVSAGLANGLSQMYNAMEHRSPLVVTAGQAESDMLIEEPLLAADSMSLARPFTKWSWELRRTSDLPIALRRGLKVALSAPAGPVFLSLPIDLMDLPCDDVEALRRPLHRSTRSPEPDLVRAASAIIREATNPIILVGDDVARSDSTQELVRLTEALGATVFALAQCEMSFPNDHPQFARTLNPSSGAMRGHLGDADVIIAVGTPLFKQLLSPRVAVLPDSARIVHLVDSEWEANKNVVSDVALVGDLSSSLLALRVSIETAMTAEDRAQAQRLRDKAATTKRDQASRLEARIKSSSRSSGIDELRLMSALRSVLPADFTVVEEAPSAASAMQQVFAFSQPRSLFGNRGAALGWGMAAALGVQLAMPDHLVVAVVGDGAANYSIQALWTAAHHRLPAKFVVCNNRQYKILKTNLVESIPDVDQSGLVGMDLTAPDIDFVALANGYGVSATRIETPDRLVDGLNEAMRTPGPFLVDVALTMTGPGA